MKSCDSLSCRPRMVELHFLKGILILLVISFHLSV